MKKTFAATINLSAEDVKGILLAHFGLPAEAKITFNLRECGDDRMGGYPQKEFGGADIVSQMPNPKAPKALVFRGAEEKM